MARREAICKCGLRVISDDESLSIAHEEPQCEWSDRVTEIQLGEHFAQRARELARLKNDKGRG
jgi:hypothetical protein